tara:strand:+ start:1434 stop:1799 length:366 start_codon:yes stop_codon:yes gene_type:complete
LAGLKNRGYCHSELPFFIFATYLIKRKYMISSNEYFEGTVKSLGYTSATGKSTIGVMEPGEYEFGTSSKENMIVVEGELIALLPGESEWKSFKAGTSFKVGANTSFKVKSVGQTSYLCQYE